MCNLIKLIKNSKNYYILRDFLKNWENRGNSSRGMDDIHADFVVREETGRMDEKKMSFMLFLMKNSELC